MQPVSIRWIGGQATTMVIDRELVNKTSPVDIHIRLAGSTTDILGEFSDQSKTIHFKPLLAFTNSLTYEVWVGNKLYTTITIENPDKTKPSILSVFPLPDTVPVNLLKFYLVFSKSMQEGVGVRNIKVVKSGRDTVPVFLDLEQELWNKESTMLTLWLDPGRIKHDLQPNILDGPPLEENIHYELVLVKPWSDQQGFQMQEQVLKRFFTGAPDTVSPLIEKWELNAPRAGTKDPLFVQTNEMLDHVLLENVILVRDQNKIPIEGCVKVTENGNGFMFTPNLPWNKGNYQMEAEKRLEDLAGNNLERLFDQDISIKKKISIKNYRKHFQIQ